MNNHIDTIIRENSLSEALSNIQHFMEKELHSRSIDIRKQHHVIDSLLRDKELLKQELATTQKELSLSKQTEESKKQLLDKLLSDVARLQHDLDWYKRTYEERTFWGTVKEKIKRRL